MRLVYDINAMHAYGRDYAPIAQGLVCDINAPHASGLRESKHAYGRSSAPIPQGLVYDINAHSCLQMQMQSRRDTHGVSASACWETDRCDREKSIWSVTTGPDLLVCDLA